MDQVKFSKVKCKPVKFKIEEGTTQYCVTTARIVPIPLQSKKKKEPDRMKELDTIEEVTEPTDWVSPMVPVPKANGEVRICVDLRELTQAIQREQYMIPMFYDIIHELRGSTIFSKCSVRILADTPRPRNNQTNHIQYSLWSLLREKTTILDKFSSRNLHESSVRNS
ncbi:Pol polyprotein [Elysia marginata]|uniref:Pol polyprotein n=1 Tax=Elysia marginata TaxID=1093978 RepID=A0AAV4GGX8_9GAST|nr:Pol polyprotein [Elysia marginata]